MRVWVREIFGAILILTGLALAGLCVWFFFQSYIIEGGCLASLSVLFTYLGTHLLKVAMAVRIVLQDRLKEDSQKQS